LDEDNNWGLDVKELERAYKESLNRCKPRAICIINPGNPTGQVLSLENMKEIIKWAYEKKLFILADEVILSQNLKRLFNTFLKYYFKKGLSR
jgi:alanine transaminase